MAGNRPSSKPTSQPTTKKAPEKRLPPVTREKPKLINKRDKAKESARKNLRAFIKNMVSRSGKMVVDKGVAQHLKVLKLRYRVEDHLNIIEKKITRIFEQWGQNLWKKLDKTGLNDREKYKKAREEITKFFVIRRKIFQTYMTIVMTSVAFASENRKMQLTPESYVRNFHLIMASLGMAKKFSSLQTITNMQVINDTAVEIRSGKRKNKLFDIHKKLSKKEALQAEDYKVLGQKYTEFLFDTKQASLGPVEKYERIAIRLLINGMSNKQRFFVIQEAIKQAPNEKQVMRIIEDFLVGGLISSAQAVYLCKYAMNHNKNTSIALMAFEKKIRSGSYNMDVAKNYQRLRTKMMKLNFAISKSNFAVKNLNIATIIGYEFLFHGALIAVMGGLLTGVMRSIENRRFDDILAVIQNPVFIGSLATLGITTEYFTKRTRHGAGLITRLLHSSSQKSAKMKEKKKLKNKDYLVYKMSQKMQTKDFFIKNYHALDRHLSSKNVTKGDYTRAIKYNSVLSFKNLKKIIPSLSPNDTFDGFKVDSPEFRRRLHLWWSLSREVEIDSPEKLRLAYNKELKDQGIPSGSFLSYRKDKAKKGLQKVRTQVQKIESKSKKHKKAKK